MMRYPVLFAATFAFGLSGALGGTAAQATNFSQLLVFGDSLVDSGNAHLGSAPADDPAPSSAGYYGGRFSNGYNFADDISLALFGTPASPFLAAPGLATNFAVGGAKAAYDPAEVSPSFLSQLGYFASTGQPISSSALVLVTFGGNDIRAVIANTGFVDFSPTVNALAFGLNALVNAGARHIVVTGLPDIGALPISQPYGALATATATARSIALSGLFDQVTDNLSLATGADVEFFDLFGLEQSLRANPAAFGLPALNTTTPCQLTGSLVVPPDLANPGCSALLYFDPVHPTTQVHGVIANAILAQLAVPEPASWALMLGGFALVGAGLRARRVTLRYAT